MSRVMTSPPLIDELADFLATGPSPRDLLRFRPSAATQRRARALLARLKDDRLADDERLELDQFVQAELLMRSVKARIRGGEPHDD